MTWRKVRVAKKWVHAEGETLEGRFLGSAWKSGEYGDYMQWLVQEKHTQQAYFVTGVVIDSLFMASGAVPGDRVRVVSLGLRQLANDREMNDFELYVNEKEESA